MSTAATEHIVINILRREGEQSMESLWHRSGLDWAQVFDAIDLLSRSGRVWLRRAAVCDYRVSLGAPQ